MTHALCTVWHRDISCSNLVPVRFHVSVLRRHHLGLLAAAEGQRGPALDHATPWPDQNSVLQFKRIMMVEVKDF